MNVDIVQVEEPDNWKEIHLEHLRWLITAYGIDLVIDAGANLGQFGLALRKIGYAHPIVSFEPVPEIARELAGIASSDANWRVLPCALGRRDSTSEMNISSGTGSSMLRPSSYGRSAFTDLRTWRTESVPVHRLDSLLPGIVPGFQEARIFLKMDTQGYDLEVFGGATDILPNIVAIQSELPILNIYDEMPSLATGLSTYADAGFQMTGSFRSRSKEGPGSSSNSTAFWLIRRWHCEPLRLPGNRGFFSLPRRPVRQVSSPPSHAAARARRRAGAPGPDQRPVEAFCARFDPAFSECVRTRCPDRCAVRADRAAVPPSGGQLRGGRQHPGGAVRQG